MWVVPCRMLFSSVFTARSRTSSGWKFCLAFATSEMASSSVPWTDLQRSSRHDLSRWMWVSMKPGETRRPPRSISSPSAASPTSTAAMRPPSIPMSTGGSFSAPAISAFLRIRSMVSSPQAGLTSPAVWMAPLLHAGRNAWCCPRRCRNCTTGTPIHAHCGFASALNARRERSISSRPRPLEITTSRERRSASGHRSRCAGG